MKTSQTILVVVALITLLSDCSKTDNAPQRILIAQYPLTSDGNDITGLNEPMILTNAPFQNGGAYSNGIYEYDSATLTPPGCTFPNPKASVIISEALRFFNLQSFSISMDFFVSERKTQPVWVAGAISRWLGFYLYADGTVALLHDNSEYLATPKTYSLNQWHTALITYDGATAKMFLDNELAGSLTFKNSQMKYGHYGNGLNNYSDNQIGVVNFSNGSTFKGYVRNLTIYSPL